MNKLNKAFRKFKPFEQEIILDIFSKLKIGDEQGLDVKKLKGYKDTYRVRKSTIRFVYRKIGINIEPIWLGYRDEDTYKNL
jgi:mRNA-degrading endonuclease RelE of RelBE toxin-antitoxin system